MQHSTSRKPQAPGAYDPEADMQTVTVNNAEYELLNFLQTFDASEMQYLMLRVIRLARAYQMEVLQQPADLDAIVVVHLLSTKIADTEVDNWRNIVSPE